MEVEKNLSGYRVSIDVGGTFTDLVVLNEKTGEILNFKISSTPRKPADAVIETFKDFLRRVKPEKVSTLTHASTIAVNALLGQLELELPKLALITTKGFRDILEIGRQRRHELYNLFVQRPRMLIPRKRRYEVDERTGPEGEVLEPLNTEAVRFLAARLKRENVEAVAIALLHSYMNPKHEREIRNVLQEVCPEIFVTSSSEIAPEHREFERTSTAVVNACLMPIVSVYMNDLSDRLRKLGVLAPLCVMQSSGGIATKDVITKKPVSMVESGPAAGVIASSFYGKMLKIENIISFDMGGTTAKAGTVRHGTSEVVTEYEVAGKVHSGRIVKGSGYPVRFSFLDLAECSAGGGTIAWVDRGGALRVGPLSAGADPGPVCYGKGGEKPTVTDANLILGRLNPNYMLGGRMKIFPDLAKESVKKENCEKTGLGLTEAAAGILRIVNSSMAKILRIVSVERGHDPRKFTLNSFGGAGPMHACALAEELHISNVIVPINPGLFSALGLLTADFTYGLVKAIMKTANDVKLNDIETMFKKMQAEGMKVLESQKVKPSNMTFLRQLDMRYFGQGYELTVPVLAPLTREEFDRVIESFHSKHEAVYGYAVRGENVELVNARLVAVGIVTKPRLTKQKLFEREPAAGALLTTRDVFFEKYEDSVKCPVYIREKLKPGNLISGPAVIEQYDATTVVYPDWKARVDIFGNLLMTFEREE
jgi:N-methylhydantoinase A